MESQRTFLFIALLLVSYLLFQEWQKDYNPQLAAPAAQTQSYGDSSNTNANAPAAGDVPVSAPSAAQKPVTEAERYVTVTTNVLSLTIDTVGGDVVAGKLLNYPVEQGEDPLVDLLANHHKAQSGLIGRDGPDGSRQGRPRYTTPKQDYSVLDGGEVVVPLTWVNTQGLSVTKSFTIKADEYDIPVSYTITNRTGQIRTVQTYAQLKKIIPEPESTMMMNAYNAATYSTSEEVYEKYDLDDMLERNLLKNTKGGWVAMQQHYFVAAWVPNGEQQNQIYSAVSKVDGSAIIGFKGPEVDIQPGESQTIDTVLYAGPKNQKKLEVLSESLALTVDYGPLWFISQMLFTLLNMLHAAVSNWGVAIILITIIVKSILYPLTKKQIISGVRMRQLQPKIEQLKERFGDDKQKMGPAMMELYKKEKVNPVSGCLPLLLQMPIFLALYWMLMESVELRHAEFIFWITDLSSKDPYFLLPVLYGASMFVMQKLTPTPSSDPMQQKVLMWMPVFFSVLFVVFPSGLVLYWVINNIMQILQTLYIQKRMESGDEMDKATS